MATETNTLAEAISNTFLAMMENIHTCLPGVIVDYNFKKSSCSVKPLIKKSFIDGDILTLPIIRDVPVVFPRTATAGITFPINKGDSVLIYFSERSLDKWKNLGKDAVPGNFRKFDLSDAICIPGLYSLNTRNIAKNNNDLALNNEGQTITIKKNGDIEIGGSGLLKLVNENFKSIFDAHVHNVTVAGTPAAQAGTTSSPSVAVGTAPIVTPPIALPPTNLFNDSIPTSALTSKTRAE